MRILLLFLFLAYPVLELALLIKLGSSIGLLALIGIIVATAIVGGLILRNNGLIFLRNMTEAMSEGRPPVGSALDTALIGTAGLMLIAPGLITDLLGAILLIPPVRALLIAWGRRLFFLGGTDPFPRDVFRQERPGTPAEPANENAPQARPFGQQQRPQRTPIVIDGEFERLYERTVKDNPKSPDGDGSARS